MTPTNHRETADDYRGEVLRLGRFRIAVCKDGIQWLFQRQRGANAGGGAQFDTLGFCRSRDGLMRLHRSHIGPDVTALACFPERFSRGAGK